VEFGDTFIGYSVMSRCRCIIKGADDLVDCSGGNHVIMGDWVVVSFHEI
jgi:hypothetical protein